MAKNITTSSVDLNAKVSTHFNIHNDNAKTVDDKIFVHNVSTPNELHKFASYNALFTLSALNQADIENTKTLLTSRPHDIIIKSGGIADSNFGTHMESSANNRESRRDPNNAFNKTIDKARIGAVLGKSSRTFKKDRDLYFNEVRMNAIPGLNEKRRLTSVTQINMTIIEPAGITLFERMRAAAANNGYLDHLDAPYLLTVEFAGFDEHGNQPPGIKKERLKRLIPIKMTNMKLDVNQGGTVYTATAIPYNEFAYLDQYNYPRTSGTLFSRDQKLNTVVQDLEDILNLQNEDETKTSGVSIPDKYEISIDKSFDPQSVTINKEFFNQSPMISQAVDTGDVPVDFMKINTTTSVIKVLEEIMKSDPRFSDISFKKWKSKVADTLSGIDATGGAQAVYEASKNKSNMWFDYFRIRSSVVPTEQYDLKRQTNVKKIKFVVSPYRVHAYSLSIPGVSTGQNFKNFVYKTYNYIFTGDNVDVLDLDINYKVAYFQSRLKDVEGDESRKNKYAQSSTAKQRGTDNPDDTVQDQNLTYRSNPGLAKSNSTNKTGGGFTFVDQFIDELTHPLADMVNVRMEILGDPAWLGQSQFIPAVPEKVADGVSKDDTIDFWRGNLNAVWDVKRGCYNPDLAEPIIMLNFKMPTDLDNKTGIYEMGSSQQGMFSGLYRVVQVEHNFNSGRYTNVLQLTRFNNQGVYISSPVDEYVLSVSGTGDSYVTTKKEADEFAQYLKDEGSGLSEVINIGRKIKDLYTEAKNIFSRGRL
tara:strand:+ start:4897 stop:7167 length:2271 start_codon:yes stop_codon:yes gene_type:complete